MKKNNRVMREDETFNINFVKKIEAYKCLYDYTRADYKNLKTQESSWKEIANEYKETVPSCKERWRNLRGCFTRNLKQKASKSPRYRKPYYLSEYMTFLKPFTKPRKQYRNHSVKNEMGDSESNEEQQQMEHSDESIEHEIIIGSPLHTSNTISINNLDESAKRKYDETETIIQIEPTVLKATNITEYTEPKKENSFTEYYELRKEKEQTEYNCADWCFLKSLLPDVLIMNQSQKRKLRIKFLKAIDEILSDETL